MQYFNLIIGYFDESGTSNVPIDRFYSKNILADITEGRDLINISKIEILKEYPAIFTEEIQGDHIPLAYIGWIDNIRDTVKSYKLEYRLLRSLPPIRADMMAKAFDIEPKPRGIGVMQHSHWVVLKGDLFRTLFNENLLDTIKPRIFATPKQQIKNNLVSVMMSFDKSQRRVYECLKEICDELDLDCKRADDIWDESIVIQDIYNLLYCSKIVICDFTGKNANVFYEAGIAHTLGKDVIPITQNKEDIPFDLSHHRYIKYLNNNEGLQELKNNIRERIRKLAES